MLSRHGHDLPHLLGEIAGAGAEDAERAARRGAVTRLDLACFTATRAGEADVEIRWTLQRLLDRAPASDEAMLDTLVGRRKVAALGLDAFAHVEPIDFLVRLLRGALGEAAAGVNILIYGPLGTGKTELARTLAAAAGAVLHGVGEADEDGEEPRRGRGGPRSAIEGRGGSAAWHVGSAGLLICRRVAAAGGHNLFQSNAFSCDECVAIQVKEPQNF